MFNPEAPLVPLKEYDKDRKVAFITGVTGQDGSYLVELLLSKGAGDYKASVIKIDNADDFSKSVIPLL